MFALAIVTALPLALPGPIEPQLPERAYQPRLFEPGLDGGRQAWFGRGDLTPDGKVLVAYRRIIDPVYDDGDGNYGNDPFRAALTVSVVRPDRMLQNQHGHLDGFYEPLTGNPHGQEFALGSTDEWTFVHWAFELIPCNDPMDPDCISPCAGGFLTEDVMPDPFYPLPLSSGGAMITLALRPAPKGNPFRSNAGGVYKVDGAYKTYELWLVRVHTMGYEENLECNPSGSGPLVKPVEITPGNPVPSRSILVSQNLTVTIDEATSTVVSVQVDQYEEIETPLLDGDNLTRGIEPSITEDGQLLIFHGNGADGGFNPGNGNVTYIYNPLPCEPTGWSAPRSITQLPSAADLQPPTSGPPTLPTGSTGLTLAQFKNHYKLFAQPIKLPPTGTDPVFEYAPGESIRGTYPWISKDGSFYTAACAGAAEAVDPGGNGLRTRVGNYACGEITGGYIKYIDDAGINPTRLGGQWHWPPYLSSGTLRNSWRTLTFSTGLKPGPWEPLLGEDAPMPTQVASHRIPVMPVFVPTIDAYGEIRFEEADGNYLLYLACNESLELDTMYPPGERNLLFDARSTPDTSGRNDRASAALNAGAAFPRDVFEVNSSAEELRTQIGAALGNAGPLHENAGFKGQAIVFNLTGVVDVRDAEGLGGAKGFTAQVFVKALVMPPAGYSLTVPLIEHGGDTGGGTTPVFTLSVNEKGKFKAVLETDQAGVPMTRQILSSNGAIDFGQPLTDPTAGWRHVAVVYDGNVDGSKSQLRLYLDGLLDKTAAWNSTTEVLDPGGAPYYLVGPGLGSGANTVNETNMSIALDEVAVSDVPRTVEELRRDAYVVPEASPFTTWPAGAPNLPLGLDPEEVEWPVGVSFDSAVVDLGRALFASPTLSATGVQSCTTCHLPTASFTDSPNTFPKDVGNNPLPPFNTPTLLNAAFGGHKTFAGSAASLEDQIVLPLTSGTEMGVQTMAEVVARINLDASLDFVSVFGEPATEENLARALAMFMRTLNTGASPFDNERALVNGGPIVSGALLSAKQRRGQGLFFGKARCFGCHRGSNFSDDDFHNIRSVQVAEGVDGRGGFTGRDGELGKLKTPTLRNVKLTGPWFHDGSKISLVEVVEHYDDPFVDPASTIAGSADRHLRPLGLTASEKADLVAFLKALTGTEPQ